MDVSPSIPLKSAVGYSLQASQWQKCPVLLDIDEMQDLLKTLGHFWIVPISGIIPKGQESFSKEVFLDVYSLYVNALKQGELPSDERLRSYFSTIFTVDLNTLYAVPIREEHYLIKINKPVVQLQAHRFDYSFADHKFRSMVMGYDSIYWGIQFSFPHLYQDDALQVFTVREGPLFPNATLFKILQQWMRSHTIATPFEVEGKKINVPIRLGKHCLSWINQHPQLHSKSLRVIT